MSFAKVLSVLLSASLALSSAAPTPDERPSAEQPQLQQQLVLLPRQGSDLPAGGTILIPISRLSQTQIGGQQYVILPANGFAPTQQLAPGGGRFFLRSAGPQVTQQQQTLIPVPIQQTVQVPQPTLRLAQPVAAPIPLPLPSPAVPVAQPVLVKQQILEPGKKVAVFRKPVKLDDSAERTIIESPPTPYQFGYSIQSDDTGDKKSASEISDGKTVKGSYSVVEPDGTLRVVDYVADHTGFTARVQRTEGAFPAIPDPVRRPEHQQ